MIVFINSGSQQNGALTGPNYQDILSWGAYSTNAEASAGTNYIGLSGLTENTTYQVQLWTPYWNDPAFSTRFSASLPDAGTNANATNQSPTLALGFGGTEPQFVIGTFTADATTQRIYYYGDSGYGVVGAIAVSTIPEPSTFAALGFGAVVFCFLARRRSRTRLG